MVSCTRSWISFYETRRFSSIDPQQEKPHYGFPSDKMSCEQVFVDKESPEGHFTWI